MATRDRTFVKLRRGIADHMASMTPMAFKVYIGLLILAEHDSGKAYLSMEGLCNLVGASRPSVSRAVDELTAAGYLVHKPATNQWDQSVFTILKYNGACQDSLQAPEFACKESSQAQGDACKESSQAQASACKESLRAHSLSPAETAPKNKNEEEELKEEETKLVKEVVEYLNERSGKDYKTTTAKTRQVIRARSREGFGIKDFRRVIDFKVDEWGKDSEMQRYIRPETLFGTKFEGYLNSVPTLPVTDTTAPTGDPFFDLKAQEYIYPDGRVVKRVEKPLPWEVDA